MALLNTNIGPERVQVFDRPIGTVQIPGASTSVTAFLIATTLVGAPVNSPVVITDMSQFEDAFGTADEVLYDGYYAVEGFYNNAGSGANVIIVNVGSSPTAASFIGSAGAQSGLRALDAQDNLSLISVPGLPIEMAYLVHPALIDYTETVRAEFGSTLSTSFSVISIPKEISKAENDELVTSAPKFVSKTGSGPYVITVDDGLGGAVSLAGIKPGMVAKSISQAFESVISAVGVSTITVLTNPGTNLVDGDDIFVYIPSAVNYKDFVVNNPSRTTGWFFNNVVVTDRTSAAVAGDVVVSDPSGHVCGVMARIDSNIAIGGVSHAPAGIQFAGIAGIFGLNLALSERVDAEPLRLAFVNRITSFPGAGFVIFGGYTAAGTAFTADEQLIQVIRSVQYIKASLEPGLRGFLWENFSPETQAQVERAIEAFLRNNIHLFPAGLPEAQQFKVISVEPTQNELDVGLLRVRIQVRPNKAVRFIEIALEYPLPTA